MEHSAPLPRVAMLRDSDEHTAAEVMLRGWAIKGPGGIPLVFFLDHSATML